MSTELYLNRKLYRYFESVQSEIMGSLRKPTIVLVHGAFQWPDCFDRLIPYLEDAGYAVNNHIRLPSTGNASTSSLQQDADTVREAVLHILDGDQQRQEEGSDCVMVMHSYGAIPTAQALRGLSREERGLNNTAVVKMVYLSCNMPRVGESHRQQLEDLSTRMGLRRTHDHVAINVSFREQDLCEDDDSNLQQTKPLVIDVGWRDNVRWDSRDDLQRPQRRGASALVC